MNVWDHADEFTMEFPADPFDPAGWSLDALTATRSAGLWPPNPLLPPWPAPYEPKPVVRFWDADWCLIRTPGESAAVVTDYVRSVGVLTLTDAELVDPPVTDRFSWVRRYFGLSSWQIDVMNALLNTAPPPPRVVAIMPPQHGPGRRYCQ